MEYGNTGNSMNQSTGPDFGQTRQMYNLYSLDQSRSFQIKMVPKVDKGFFLGGESQDWICYRRNYFAGNAWAQSFLLT